MSDSNSNPKITEEVQLICFCHGVTEDEIRKTIQAGAHTITEIQKQVLASTGCGGCYCEVERILAEEMEKIAKKE